MVQSLDATGFEKEVIQGKGLVLVDFWAEWCGPCRMLAPVLDEMQNEMPHVAIYKVDVDSQPEISGQYGVRSIPTLMAFRDGKLIDTKVGGSPKASLVNWLSSL